MDQQNKAYFRQKANDKMRDICQQLLTGFAWDDTAAGHEHWNKIWKAIAEGIRLEENRKD